MVLILERRKVREAEKEARSSSRIGLGRKCDVEEKGGDRQWERDMGKILSFVPRAPLRTRDPSILDMNELRPCSSSLNLSWNARRPPILSAESITRCLGQGNISPEAVSQGLGVPPNDDPSLLNPRLHPFFYDLPVMWWDVLHYGGGTSLVFLSIWPTFLSPATLITSLLVKVP